MSQKFTKHHRKCHNTSQKSRDFQRRLPHVPMLPRPAAAVKDLGSTERGLRPRRRRPHFTAACSRGKRPRISGPRAAAAAAKTSDQRTAACGRGGEDLGEALAQLRGREGGELSERLVGRRHLRWSGALRRRRRGFARGRRRRVGVEKSSRRGRGSRRGLDLRTAGHTAGGRPRSAGRCTCGHVDFARAELGAAGAGG